jgi:hypothetical protein
LSDGKLTKLIQPRRGGCPQLASVAAGHSQCLLYCYCLDAERCIIQGVNLYALSVQCYNVWKGACNSLWGSRPFYLRPRYLLLQGIHQHADLTQHKQELRCLLDEKYQRTRPTYQHRSDNNIRAFSGARLSRPGCSNSS